MEVRGRSVDVDRSVPGWYGYRTAVILVFANFETEDWPYESVHQPESHEPQVTSL